MNERIQELAYKAGMRHPVMGEIVYSSFSHEEFAELIVRECIDTLLWHGCDDAVPYIEWMAKNKLGQRFGVE